MRVLLFSSAYRPNVGGVETVTARLAHELKARRHDVSVVTNRYPRGLPAYETIDGISVSRRLYPNIVPSPGRRPVLVLAKQVLSVPLALYELVWLFQLLRRERPDVVNVHYLSYPAMYALVAARVVGIPVVLSFHGSDVPSCPYPATYRWVGRVACRLAALVTCNSEDLAGYLRQDVARRDIPKIQVRPFGIDDWTQDREVRHAAEEEPAGARSDTPFALVAARLVEKKGVECAIRALAKAGGPRQSADDEDRPPLRLKIAGSGPLDASLRRSADDLALTDRIEFLGALEPARLRALMLRAAFVVVPSLWEAFGVVALDAMIAGRAVVAANRGGIAEIVVDGKSGLIVEAGDPKALAAAMTTLFERPALAAELGANGRARALEVYNWNRAVSALSADFGRTTGGGSGTPPG